MAASDRFTIKVKGRQTHGSRPWGGVDPIVAAADLIGTAQTIVSRRTDIAKQPAVVTFGAIKGGIRYNIIPDEVELIGTIRTFDEGMRAEDLRRPDERRRARRRRARRHRRSRRCPTSEGNPVTVNDPALTARMLPSLQAVVGADNVVEPPLHDGRGGFLVLRAAKCRRCSSSSAPRRRASDPLTAPSNHSPEFLLDESALDLGLRAMLQVTLDYLHGEGA